MTTLIFADGGRDTGCLTSWRRDTVTIESAAGRRTYARSEVERILQ